MLTALVMGMGSKSHFRNEAVLDKFWFVKKKRVIWLVLGCCFLKAHRAEEADWHGSHLSMPQQERSALQGLLSPLRSAKD